MGKLYLFSTVYGILAHIFSKNFKKSRDPEHTRILQNFNMCNGNIRFFTFNLQTKFEMSSFIRFKNMSRAQKCRNGSRDPDNAHLGDSQSSQANYCTKFEVSSFSRSGVIRGV